MSVFYRRSAAILIAVVGMLILVALLHEASTGVITLHDHGGTSLLLYQQEPWAYAGAVALRSVLGLAPTAVGLSIWHWDKLTSWIRRQVMDLGG